MLRVCLLFALVLSTSPVGFSQPPSPVVDFVGLMGNVDIMKTDGRLVLDGQTKLYAAFLPEGSAVKGVLYKAGQSTPIYSHAFKTQPFYGVFTSLSCEGLTTDFFFKEAGDYVLSMQANGTEITRVSVLDQVLAEW